MARLAAVIAEADGTVAFSDRRQSSDIVVDRYADKHTADQVTENEAALVSLAIESLRIDPNTLFVDLTRFRESHSDQLTNYRKAIRELARQACGITDEEQRWRELNRIVKEELNPSQDELTGKLGESDIEFSLNVLEIASAATVGWVISGGSLMGALATAGVDLGWSVVRWRIAQSKGSNEPLSYLVNLRKQLGGHLE
jgi:hypothetical protein